MPAMEARKDDLLNGTRNLEDEIQMLKSSLENYESVTNRLKSIMIRQQLRFSMIRPVELVRSR